MYFQCHSQQHSHLWQTDLIITDSVNNTCQETKQCSKEDLKQHIDYNKYYNGMNTQQFIHPCPSYIR